MAKDPSKHGTATRAPTGEPQTAPREEQPTPARRGGPPPAKGGTAKGAAAAAAPPKAKGTAKGRKAKQGGPSRRRPTAAHAGEARPNAPEQAPDGLPTASAGVEAPARPLPDMAPIAAPQPPEPSPPGDTRGAAEPALAQDVAPGEPAGDTGAASPPGDEERPAARAPFLHVVPSDAPAPAPRVEDVVDAAVLVGTQGAGAPPPSSGGASSPGLAARAAGALALAQGVLAQTLASPALREAAQAAQGLAKAVRSGLGAGGSRAVDAYGRDEDLVRDLRPLADFLYHRYWRVSVQGAEHVPSGPALLVANHSGAVPYDGPVLQQALLRERPELPEARWLVEDQVFYAPFFGTLFNRLGALRASPENALRLLGEGRPVIVFPEGVQGLGKLFRERYRLKRFGRGGFVKLALRAGVPIVPVAIVGAEESTPLLAKLPGSVLGLPYIPITPLGPLPLPARWTLRFGTPVDLEGHGEESADTLAVVQRLAERTRDTIQGMLEAVLRERPGVFGG